MLLQEKQAYFFLILDGSEMLYRTCYIQKDYFSLQKIETLKNIIVKPHCSKTIK